MVWAAVWPTSLSVLQTMGQCATHMSHNKAQRSSLKPHHHMAVATPSINLSIPLSPPNFISIHFSLLFPTEFLSPKKLHCPVPKTEDGKYVTLDEYCGIHSMTVVGWLLFCHHVCFFSSSNKISYLINQMLAVD